MDGKLGKKRKRRNYNQPPVKIPQDVLLQDAVVQVVARSGIEGTSTRSIAAEAAHGITDKVIYRYFEGKEDLMRKTFLRETGVCMKEAESRFSVLWEDNLPLAQRLRFLWHSLWTWTTAHSKGCTFIIRYYYCSSFDAQAYAEYRAVWAPLVDRLKELVPGEETEPLFFMALETLASAAYPVCSGRTPDSASASEYGFRRLMGLVNEFIKK